MCVYVCVCFSNLTINIHICYAGEYSIYGLDAEADFPNENDETGGVIVPETLCPFDEEDLIIFRQNIHATENEDKWNTQTPVCML